MMRKLFVVLFTLSVLLAACDTGAGVSPSNIGETPDNGTGGTPTAATSFEISNQSGYKLLNVRYSVDFGTISPGQDLTKNISAGTKYIYFDLDIAGTTVSFRVNDAITVEENKKEKFIFQNTTLITTITGDRTDTLKAIYDALMVELNDATSLEISNQSGYQILNVRYSNINFDTINIGQNLTKNVIAGSTYIYFDLRIAGKDVSFRTTDTITVEKDMQGEFIFENTTRIISTITDSTDTLKAVYDVLIAEANKPQIVIKQGVTTITNGDVYDFGTLLIERSKDVTFTIENAGIVDYLTIDSIEGSRIGLIDNDSGFFSLVMQPPAYISIAPGSSTSFIIRFSPETEGYLFSAAIRIKTNSRNNGDFIFIVKGSAELSAPQIVIKQGVTTITNGGEYDFGTLSIGRSQDITFTIENSGTANLIIDMVEGDRIALLRNASGYFSVITEPLSGTIAPGAIENFVIRFNPMTEGNLFNTSVQIKTNSKSNADFIFRVKGNGNKVGDTGSVPEGMVLVPAGTYMMGSNNGDSDEKPVHQVTISKPYYMGKYEVTQAEWVKIMGNNPSNWKGDTLPVESVSWNEAVEYCNKRSLAEGLMPCYSSNGSTIYCNFSANGYRLPTEAEWEWAARGGGKDLLHYDYSGSNNVGTVAWYTDNSGGRTHPVGQKQGNSLGLYDMSGNVWEWCWDWYGGYSGSNQTDPAGAASGAYRVLRGGSWNISAAYVRSAYRSIFTPGNRYYYSGFRLVRSF